MGISSSKPASARELAQHLEGLIRRGQWAAGQKLPSIRQIARQQDVSVGTVQRALTQLEALQLISYRPRRRGVVRDARPPRQQAPQRATQVAVVFPGPMKQPQSPPSDAESWSRHIVQAVQWTLTNQHMDLLFLTPPSADDRVGAILRRIDESGAALGGVVAFQLQQMTGLAEELDCRALPWVAVDRPAADSQHNYVSLDFTRAGHGVGRAFAAGGARRVLLLLADPQKYRSSAELSAGFVQAYLESGRSSAGIVCRVCQGSMEEVGYEVTREHLAQAQPPQAVLAGGDRLAIGAIRAFQEAGLRVPEDVSVVGATGLELSRYTRPSVAVIQQPMQRIGQLAAEMLLEMRRTSQRRLPGLLLAPTLIARQSLRLPAAVRAQWVVES